MLQEGGGVGQNGAFLLDGAGLIIQGDGNGGAVMQQAACGAFWQELGGVGGNENRCRQMGVSGAWKVMTRSSDAQGM